MPTRAASQAPRPYRAPSAPGATTWGSANLADPMFSIDGITVSRSFAAWSLLLRHVVPLADSRPVAVPVPGAGRLLVSPDVTLNELGDRVRVQHQQRTPLV